MKPEIEDLVERLTSFHSRHRMQFGLHPDNELILETIKAIQAQSQTQQGEPKAAAKTAPTKSRGDK